MSILANNEIIKSLSLKYGTPFYIYDAEILFKNIAKIKTSFSYKFLDIHFALMCNTNPHLLQIMCEKGGVKAFVCSTGELFVALKCGFRPEDIMVSGTGFTDDELTSFIEKGIQINIDSLGLLERYGKLNPGGSVGIRINFDFSKDFHPNVHPEIYWGTTNRMGVWETDIHKALKVAQESNLKIIGLHQYSGTNILDHRKFQFIIEKLFALSVKFDSLQYIDIGGGFGIDYENAKDFSWTEFGDMIDRKMEDISLKLKRNIHLKLEPGRAIIASAGALVGKIVDIKEIDNTLFLNTDLSLSNFIRPYLYNAYHRANIFPHSGEEPSFIHDKTCYVCGNTVAINDFLAKDRQFAQASIGDLILIEDAGAYGYSMSSDFCGRTKPPEILISNGEDRLIRQREDFGSLLYGTGY